MKLENSKFFTKEIVNKLVADINIALWVWECVEDNLYYNIAFFKLLGYDENDKTIINVDDWVNIIHPDDRKMANDAISDYMDGTKDSYFVECRLIQKNGDIIWICDSGEFTKYDENGRGIEFSGITQNITKQKLIELKLIKDEQKLRLAMKSVGFSAWEYSNNTITCDEQYVYSLGYLEDGWQENIQNWIDIVHPEDAEVGMHFFNSCARGEIKSYDHKFRIKKFDGTFIWVRDVVEAIEFDENGNAVCMVGARLNIDELETAYLKLASYQDNLEAEIKQRTEDLMRRDTVLLELNQITKKLMETPTSDNFNQVVFECLEGFSSVGKNSRLSIFRNKMVDNKPYCYLANHRHNSYNTQFTREHIRKVFEDVPSNYISNETFNDDNREEFFEMVFNGVNSMNFSSINYERYFPTIYRHVQENKILNFQTQSIHDNEFIFARLQGIKSVLMSPIIIGNEPWGFILLDDIEERRFNEDDEKMLTLVGSVLAQAIHKNELELIANEAIEYNQLMLDATPIGCTLWEDGENIGSNLEVCKLFKVKNQADYKEKFLKLSPEYQPCGMKSADLVVENFEKVEKQGRMQFEWMHNDIDGKVIPCEITLVKVPRGDDYLVAGYIRDLTDFKALISDIEKTQENLKLAHEEALLSSKAKTNFLANMSHEIRTPMNAISGMTDIILRETQNSDINDYAINIKRACDSLLAIINDVLDISKIESGKLSIVEGEYKLSHVLNDVLSIASNRLELKPLMFTSNFACDLPDKIIGDDVRVKQIMVNILNNAIKFTNEGNISFDVWGELKSGTLELKFSVTDTGSGISDDDLDKLFIEFERVNTTKNRSIEGTGLGLAISKRLCEMMGGHIEVESQLGVGTKFTITILQKYYDYSPIAKVDVVKSVLVFESRDIYRSSIKSAFEGLDLTDVVYCSLQSEFNEALQDRDFDFIFTSSMYLVKVQEMILKHNSNCKIILLADNNDIKSMYDYATIVIPVNCISIANVLNGKISNNSNQLEIANFTAPDCNVLVVDDNLVNIKVAQGLLRPYLFNIDTAENGLEAISKIKDNKYDLVFMDHMMPVMDGIDATIAIRLLDGDYFKNLPIVALTANAIIGTKEMFINEGMNDFLAKPIKLTTLNEVLAKWLPKDKQIAFDTNDLDDSNQNLKRLEISNLDFDLGISRVGGNFDTFVDILDMYYKDGIKRISNIRDLLDKKLINEYKIEVHALKSASASVGATDISNKARLLEEASIKGDWGYINLNATEFIDDFNILLENIREAIKGVVGEVDNSSKEFGEDTLFVNTCNELIEALDNIDINTCSDLIDTLFKFNWSESRLDSINQINDLFNSYEYDEAVELIQSIL